MLSDWSMAPLVEALRTVRGITAVLWMQRDQPRARQLLDEWLLAPGSHEAELRHAVGTLRASVVAGYVSGKAADIKLRERAQLLAKQGAAA